MTCDIVDTTSKDVKKCNSNVTKKCNPYRVQGKKKQAFLDKMWKINVEEERLASFHYFPELSGVNFRQMILRLDAYIELVDRVPFGRYKLKGVDCPIDLRCVTYDGMEVGINIVPLLSSLREQPPAIHNLKFKFEATNNFYENLISEGFEYDLNNHGISIDYSFDSKIDAKVMVYPKTVVVDIACTFKPFIYDVGSVLSMLTRLGELYHILKRCAGHKSKILRPEKWIVTQYHFGKDSLQEISDEKFHYTWSDVAGGLVRFYAKQFPDGKVRVRVEKVVTPNKPLQDVISEVVENESTAKQGNSLDDIIGDFMNDVIEQSAKLDEMRCD